MEKDTKVNMTSVQIASDFHIEYRNDTVPDPSLFLTPAADILILAGDIGSLYKFDQLQTFIGRVCALYQIVLYIPGNHEYYTTPGCTSLCLGALRDRLKRMEQKFPNLHLLDKNSVRIGRVCIAGCTLWTRPTGRVPQFIVRIHGMDTRVYREEHKRDLDYITRMMDYCKEKNLRLLVVTHHPPTYRVLAGGKKKKKFESLYASNLDALLTKDNTKVWVCGHTHRNFDFTTSRGCRGRCESERETARPRR